MRFRNTEIKDVKVVELDMHEDSRGSFARLFCTQEFKSAGIEIEMVQASLSRNPKPGTLRGLHYQAEPHGETKIIQCVRGRIWDVAVDLRKHSPSFRHWVGLELSPDGNRLLYIPPGCAHGFLTLDANSDVLYFMGTAYVSGSERGVRWNDSAFGIAWPGTPKLISDRDANYPDFLERNS